MKHNLDNTLPKRLLLILTGGTICSFADEKGEQQSDTQKAEALIVHNFRGGDSKCRSENDVVFDTKRPLDILSENMTVNHWQNFIDQIKNYDFSIYDGVIILHGTDTLAYTSAMLSLMLCGINIPVILVSSQLPLYNAESNGNDNFKCAVEMIAGGVAPNVYVVYRNQEQIGGKAVETMYVHYASQLLQCQNHSDNFYSFGMTPVGEQYPKFIGKSAESSEILLYKCGKLTNSVLKIFPYVGVDYSAFSLQGIKTVLHHTYHSGTMAVHTGENEIASIVYLKKRCDEKGIELYIEPCDKNKTYLYETTGTVLRSGVGTSWRTTSEMAYVKLLVGNALKLSGKELQDFMDTEINNEFVR